METEMDVVGDTSGLEAKQASPDAEIEIVTEEEGEVVDGEDVAVLRFYHKWERADVLKYTGLFMVGLLVMAVCSIIIFWGSEDGWLFDFFRWLQDAGIKGCLIVALIMVPVNFPFIVGYAMMTLAAGYLFGFWWGMFTVILGSQMGMLAVNTVVNTFLKERTEKWIENSGGRYATAIMKEIALNRAKVCFFLRILPMPIGLQNCMLSVSPIPLWMYQLFSGLGLLVKQVPEIYVGTTLNDVVEIIQKGEDFDPIHLLPIAVGAVAVVIFAIMILLFSRKVLARLREMEEAELDDVVEEVEEEEGMVTIMLEERPEKLIPDPPAALVIPVPELTGEPLYEKPAPPSEPLEEFVEKPQRASTPLTELTPDEEDEQDHEPILEEEDEVEMDPIIITREPAPE